METIIAACVLWTAATLWVGYEIRRYRMAGAVEDAYQRGVEDAQRPLPELGFERGDDNCNDTNPSHTRRFQSPWLEEMP